jgi:hypothetical protein
LCQFAFFLKKRCYQSNFTKLFTEASSFSCKAVTTIKIIIILLLLTLLTQNTYAQKQAQLIIRPSIKDVCLKNIITTDAPTEYTYDSTYGTTYMVKQITADTVAFDYLENKVYQKKIMCSHYYKKDTLIIEGCFGGMYQTNGFIAKKNVVK